MISFKITTESIIRNLFAEQNEEFSLSEDMEQMTTDCESIKFKILHAAARIIKNDVYSIEAKSKDSYQSIEEMTDLDEVNLLAYACSASILRICWKFI